MRRSLPYSLLAVLLVGLALVRGLHSSAGATSGAVPSTPVSALPGLQTGPAPWGRDVAHLQARLERLGLLPSFARDRRPAGDG